MIKFKHKKHSDKKLNESIIDILENNKLLSLSTVTPNGKAHINTAYFAFDKKLNLYIITDPKSNHCKNLQKNNSVAASIFKSSQRFWKFSCSSSCFFNIFFFCKVFDEFFSCFSSFNNI